MALTAVSGQLLRPGAEVNFDDSRDVLIPIEAAQSTTGIARFISDRKILIEKIGFVQGLQSTTDTATLSVYYWDPTAESSATAASDAANRLICDTVNLGDAGGSAAAVAYTELPLKVSSGVPTKNVIPAGWAICTVTSGACTAAVGQLLHIKYRTQRTP